jgi:hypothetical protein
MLTERRGAMSTPSQAQPTLGKSCGTCSLCCKVFDIPAIEGKTAGKWCDHCTPGSGCGIWPSRPAMCREYFCHWHRDASLGPEWRPDVARFLINNEADGVWLSIVTDPGKPNAWRREPYHSKLRRLAATLIAGGKHGLMLIDGNKKYVVLPDREVLIGRRDTHAHVQVSPVQGPTGLRYEVEIRRAA